MKPGVADLPSLQPPVAWNGRPLLIAYSGGLDSTVLLHRVRTAGLAARAIHVHHGLQPQADAWAAHCAAQAAACGAAFRCERVQVDPLDPRGPEAAARHVRYAALGACLGEGDVLATAHQRDDQAEGFLLAALRGAGPRGLGALRAWQPFGAGWLWRPQLDLSRAALMAYAQAHGLSWIEDPHNRDPRFLRARLRHEVMPGLVGLRPAAGAMLARSAALAGEADALLGEYLSADLVRLGDGETLSVTGLNALGDVRLRALLRHWIVAVRGLPPPRHELLQRVAVELLQARPDASPRLAWPGGELRRYRDRLHAQPPPAPLPAARQWTWDGASPLNLPGLGTLSTDQPLGHCEIRLTEGGERFRPRGARHHRTFRQLMQQRAVPPWHRRRLPLVWQAGRLLWIAGIGAASDAPEAFDRLRWSPAIGRSIAG